MCRAALYSMLYSMRMSKVKRFIVTLEIEIVRVTLEVKPYAISVLLCDAVMGSLRQDV